MADLRAEPYNVDQAIDHLRPKPEAQVNSALIRDERTCDDPAITLHKNDACNFIRY